MSSITAAFEVVSPINDDELVEAVAISIFRSRPEYDLMRWRDCGDLYREQVRDEARAAISVVFNYFIALEGATRHGNQ